MTVKTNYNKLISQFVVFFAWCFYYGVICISPFHIFAFVITVTRVFKTDYQRKSDMRRVRERNRTGFKGLIIHLIHYEMYISILTGNLEIHSSYSDLYILQSIKVNVDILSYYYCKCMQFISFEGG